MIVKNFLFLGIGEIAGKFFSFLAVLYLTHKISLINFGEINFALTYINYLSLLTNLGLLIYGIRKVAQELISKEIVDEIFSFRFLLGIFVTFFSIVLINILSKEVLLKKLILIYSFFIFFDAINLEWFFLGKERIKFCVLNRFLFNLFYFLLLVIFLKSEKEILVVPTAFVLGSLISSLTLLYFYYKNFNKINFKLNLKKKVFLLKETLPLGGAQILIQIYTLSGIFFLGFFNMKKELGYYSAGFRILLLLMIFDRIFNQIILPFLTRKFQEEKFAILKNITRLVLIFLLPIVFFLFIISDKLFLFLFPKEYLPGEKTFRIFLGFFIITILNSIFSLSLIAFRKDKQYFKNILIGTIINFLMVILLTKNFSHLGAAFSLLFTEFFILLLNFRTLKSFYKIEFLTCFSLPLFLAFLSNLPIFFFKNFSIFILVLLFLITNLSLFLIFRKEIEKDYYLLKW